MDSDSGHPTVDNLIAHIQCSIAKAIVVAPQNIDPKSGPPATTYANELEYKYVALVTLTLKVEDNGGVSPSLNFLTPVSSFAYGANANINVDRTRTFTTNYTLKLSTLRAEYEHNNKPCESDRIFSLSDDLGIEGIVEGGIQTMQYQDFNAPASEDTKKPDVTLHFVVDDSKTLGQKPNVSVIVPPAQLADTTPNLAKPPAPPNFGSTVQFMIAKSFDTGPLWSLKYFKGPDGSKGILNGGSTTTDQIVIAFSPGSTSKAAQQIEKQMLLLKTKIAGASNLIDLTATRLDDKTLSLNEKNKLEKVISTQTADFNNSKSQYEALQAQLNTTPLDDEGLAQATSQAQSFTTNIILQNLAGTLH
jgi:hypothetical protein